jgi:hypothetical protein
LPARSKAAWSEIGSGATGCVWLKKPIMQYQRQ